MSLVPLTLLGLALLGAFGLEDLWTDTLAPAVRERASAPVFTAIDFSVTEIFGSNLAGTIVFASLLLLWDLTWGIRAVMVALNEMHETQETRSALRRSLTALALAVTSGGCLVGAAVLVIVLPRLADGLVRVGVTIAAWAAAAVLLGLAVGLVVRYAPAERPPASWASAGSLLVIGTWIVASLLFGWWAGSVANYRSAVGSLTVFLLLTTYMLVSSAIFLIGVEVDETARKST